MQEEPENPKTDEETWENDQKRRGYYYDDSHGYEIYNPEEDETDEDEDED